MHMPKTCLQKMVQGQSIHVVIPGKIFLIFVNVRHTIMYSIHVDLLKIVFPAVSI